MKESREYGFKPYDSWKFKLVKIISKIYFYLPSFLRKHIPHEIIRCEVDHITDVGDLNYFLRFILSSKLVAFDELNDCSLNSYVSDLLNGIIFMKPRILSTIRSVKDGLHEPIEILVAHDTTFNSSLIVDGNHRAIAFYYHMLKSPL